MTPASALPCLSVPPTWPMVTRSVVPHPSPGPHYHMQACEHHMVSFGCGAWEKAVQDPISPPPSLPLQVTHSPLKLLSWWFLSPPPYLPRILSPRSQHHVHPKQRLPWLSAVYHRSDSNPQLYPTAGHSSAWFRITRLPAPSRKDFFCTLKCLQGSLPLYSRDHAKLQHTYSSTNVSPHTWPSLLTG